MAGDASWPLQQAVFAALSADAGLQALIGAPARIYDDPPDDAAFPYLVLGEGRVSDWPGAAGGIEHVIRIAAFSRYHGRAEAKQIISAVYDALHDRPLTVSGHALVNLRFVFADVFRKQDGETFEGVMRYRAVTEPTA